jgi:hypothetical protein
MLKTARACARARTRAREGGKTALRFEAIPDIFEGAGKLTSPMTRKTPETSLKIEIKGGCKSVPRAGLEEREEKQPGGEPKARKFLHSKNEENLSFDFLPVRALLRAR